MGQVRLVWVRLGQVRLGWVRLGQVRLSQIGLGQFRLGQVRLSTGNRSLVVCTADRNIERAIKSRRILCLCILIVMYVPFCIFCFHRANRHSPATLTEVFPCFFLSCKANARVKLAKTGHGPHSSELVVIVLLYVLFLLIVFYVLFVCKCVLYYCHRVSTQLRLNISYHTINYLISCGFTQHQTRCFN